VTLNANWIEASKRKDVQPIFLLTITDGITTWTAQSGAHATMVYDVGVRKVGALAGGIDFATHALRVGELEIIVSDAWLRPILVANRLKGNAMSIQWGFYDIAEGDFEDYAPNLVIEDLIPDGLGLAVRIKVFDVFELIRQTKIVGEWGTQPLIGAYDVLSDKLGLPASMINKTSLDPDAVANETIGHFMITRSASAVAGAESTTREPTPALTILTEMVRLLDGNLYINNAGEVAFKLFDPTDTEADTWTTADIVSLRQLSLYDDLINQVVVMFQNATYDGSDLAHSAYDALYEQHDSDSQANYVYPGMSERIIDRKIETGWCGVKTRIGDSIDDGGGIDDSVTSAVMYGSPLAQMAGGRQYDIDGGGSTTNAGISSVRPLYLLTDAGEIIKATSMTPNAASVSTHQQTRDPETGQIHTLPAVPHAYDISGLTRGYGGTTPAPAQHVSDISLPVYLASRMLERQANGVPRIEVHTKLHKFGVDVTDLVKITWPAYLGYGRNGISASDGKWQALSKELDLAEGTIKWILAWAGTVVPTTAHKGLTGVLQRAAPGMVGDAAKNEDAFVKAISSGLGVRIDSGFDVIVEAGVASCGSLRAEVEELTITCPASKDTYIFLDIQLVSVRATAVAIGDPAPAPNFWEIQLAKCVSDGAGVTDVDSTAAPTHSLSGYLRVKYDGPVGGGAVINGNLQQYSRGSGFPPD
jgi:hypothetical protein